MHSSTTLERGRSSQTASTCAREQAQKVGADQRKGARASLQFCGQHMGGARTHRGPKLHRSISWIVRQKLSPRNCSDGRVIAVGSARTLEQQRGARGAPGREHEAATDVGLALAAE